MHTHGDSVNCARCNAADSSARGDLIKLCRCTGLCRRCINEIIYDNYICGICGGKFNITVATYESRCGKACGRVLAALCVLATIIWMTAAMVVMVMRAEFAGMAIIAAAVFCICCMLCAECTKDFDALAASMHCAKKRVISFPNGEYVAEDA